MKSLRAIAEASAQLSEASGADWFHAHDFIKERFEKEDAEFIAACDPQTVIRLLDQIDELKSALEKCKISVGEDAYVAATRADVVSREALARKGSK